MARTPLLRRLQQACCAVAQAARRQVPVEQVMDEQLRANLTRRDFLRRAAAVGVAAASPRLLRPPGLARKEANIVVVGAGLAGLTCAYRLKQAGFEAAVYEASSRLGGRCYTGRNLFAAGQVIEHGGELIDTWHGEIQALATELGLELDDLLAAEQEGTEPFYHFGGQAYTYSQALSDFQGIWEKLQADTEGADWPTGYNRHTKRGRELDHMSVIDWIEETVPGGVQSPLGRLLDVAYNIEYGAESGDQSALNLIYLMGYGSQERFQIFGESDERFHIRGGNDQLVQRLGAELSGQIETSTRLEAIRRQGSRYLLTFERGASVMDVLADHVVLAIPFSIMRTSVDIGRALFSRRKEQAIRELGMGTNTKVHLQFLHRRWEQLGCNGETFADTGYQSTWEATRAQAGAPGILVNFTGGQHGASFSSGTPGARAAEALAGLEPVLPGITAAWNGQVTVDYWPGYRWTRGSYSYYRVGQYTQFGGAEGEREGNCHFAGEHTSTDYQGYLNGAVESGERAATEVAEALLQRRYGEE